MGRHLAFCQSGISITKARKLLINLQQGAIRGLLCLYGNIGRQHILVNIGRDGPGGRNAARFGPFDGGTHLLILATIGLYLSPVAQLFALINVGRTRRGQKHAGRQLFFLQRSSQYGGRAGLVVVGELGGVYKITALGPADGADIQYILYYISASTIIDSPVKPVPIFKVKQSRKRFVVFGHLVRSGPGFAHHIDVSAAAGIQVILVAAVIPSFQEVCIVRGGILLVNMDHSVKPKSSNAHIYPFLGTGRKAVKGSVGFQRRNFSVIQIGHLVKERCVIVLAACLMPF